MSAMAVSGFPASCWTMVSDTLIVKDYQGGVHGYGIRYDALHGKSIYAVNDRVSGFMLLTGNGIHVIDMRKDGSGGDCNDHKAGCYDFVHNQDGSGGWSASASVGALSVSYSGDGRSTLRKAATYSYDD